MPALPDPAVAPAVISAGPVWYFLARSGACPWIRRDAGPSGTAGPASAVVRWYADSGRVPAPPSPLDEGDLAAWAHAPSGDAQLASPMALLHVLALTAAATGDGAALSLPGGVRAVPAATTPSAGPG